WGPVDLFRFNSSGVRDFTGGKDGVTTYFSTNGSSPDLTHPYHNSVNSSGVFDGADPGDWDTTGDAFGAGATGTVDTISNTDMRLMDVLGWTLGGFGFPTFELGTFGANAGAGGWISENLYPRVIGDVNGGGLADVVGF